MTSLQAMDLRARRGRRATAMRETASPRRDLSFAVCLEVFWRNPMAGWMTLSRRWVLALLFCYIQLYCQLPRADGV